MGGDVSDAQGGQFKNDRCPRSRAQEGSGFVHTHLELFVCLILCCCVVAAGTCVHVCTRVYTCVPVPRVCSGARYQTLNIQ